MAGNDKAITHTGITADLVKKMRRHATGSFDGDADPVRIGLGADANAATGAVAIGHNAETNATSGTAAIAIGHNTSASEGGAISIGEFAEAVFDAIALGVGTVASVQYALAFGVGAEASAQAAIAIGRNTLAAFLNSTAIGNDAVTDRASQIMLGNGEVVDIPGAGNGLALRSPDGTRWLVTVDNTGHLTTTAVP